MTKHGRDLQIDEDLAFQRREWLAQRAGRIAVFLFVLAALLGFTGVGGPYAHGQAGTPDGAVRVDYERVVRRHASATLTLHLRGTPQQTRFWVSEPYARSINIEGISPEPQSVSVADGRYVYSVASGSSEVAVVIHVEHLTAGIVNGEVGLVGGPAVRFRQVALF
jgi:hypothetical protein